MTITINGSGTITGVAAGGFPDASIAVADLAATGTPSSSTFLRGDGQWQSASSPIGGQVFTSSGTFTIPAGVTALKVTVVGGGGGGGSSYDAGCGTYASGSGGGAGGAAIAFLTGLTPGATINVAAVGAGGSYAPKAYSGVASSGGTTTVSSGTQAITTISATGGAGGRNSGSVPYGGSGGTGSGGNLNIGGGGAAAAESGNSVASVGGNSIYGGGGRAGAGASTAGQNGQAPGAGASGAGYYNNQFGGTGAAGVVIFEW